MLYDPSNDDAMVRSLISAKDLISDPKHWTTDMLARNHQGRNCSPLSEKAVSFCAVGAMMRVTDIDLVSPLVVPTHPLRRAAAEIYVPGLSCKATPARVNNALGHAVTLGMFDRAIELAREDARAEAFATTEL